MNMPLLCMILAVILSENYQTWNKLEPIQTWILEWLGFLSDFSTLSHFHTMVLLKFRRYYYLWVLSDFFQGVSEVFLPGKAESGPHLWLLLLSWCTPQSLQRLLSCQDLNQQHLTMSLNTKSALFINLFLLPIGYKVHWVRPPGFYWDLILPVLEGWMWASFNRKRRTELMDLHREHYRNTFRLCIL